MVICALCDVPSMLLIIIYIFIRIKNADKQTERESKNYYLLLKNYYYNCTNTLIMIIIHIGIHVVECVTENAAFFCQQLFLVEKRQR